MDGKRTVAAETGSPSRSRYAGPRSDGTGTEVPGPTAAKMHATAPHATEMRTTDVRTSTSHPAAEVTPATEMTATAEMTAAAEMRAATTAVTASAASWRGVGHTRNHDRQSYNSQEIEL
jgi:hypothetical protein